MIVGRSVELEAIRRCLDGIATGPIGLVIDGPAGIGKSTLWLEAIARAEERGIRVLRARPSEAEGHMSYAVVADLIDAIFDEVGDALPGPQRRALSTALLRAEPDGSTDVRIVGTALVGIFAVLAGRSQVVVAIDDVQWLDPASHEVLEFALRRLAGPIGIILTRRTTGRADPPLRLDQVLPVGRLELIIPGPMSLAAIHHLARNRLDRTLPRTILSRIVTESEGNPFYALELAKVWTVGAARAADEVTGGGAIAMPGSIRDVVARRVQALPEAARQVVAIAAGMGRPRRSVITAIVGDRDATEGIADAVAAGVLIVSGDALRFEHPLLASAVEEGLSEQARRAVHKQLAANAEDLEEQGRHLAAAGTGPDAAVAEWISTRPEPVFFVLAKNRSVLK